MSKYYSSSIAFGAQQTKTEQVVVSTTKIGNVTTDASSGALTVDEVPTLDSLNPVSSDGVARAVIQAGAELPTRSSEDTGTVLTVINSDGDLDWVEPPMGIPDMTGKDGKILGAVDVEGTMEAKWISPPEELPGLTDNAGKVLKVNAGATGVEWANESTVTVDQTYNAYSTNPQSGTAVAEAISAIPSASYTAGNGIAINASAANQISVNHDTTLKDVAEYQSDSVGTLINSYSGKYAETPNTVYAALDRTMIVDHIKLHIPGNMFFLQDGALEGATIGFSGDQYFNSIIHPKPAAVTLSVTSSGGYTWIDEQDVIIPAPINGQNWIIPGSSLDLNYFAFFKLVSGLASTGSMFNTSSTNISSDPVVFGIPDDTVPKKLGVTNPIPAFDTTTDVGKVLTVTANGLAWVLPT